MAFPQTDLDWLIYLAQRHDAELPELERYDRYYDGQQPLTYMHPEIFREVHDRIKPVIIYWPQLVVDAVEERLDVEGFRLPDEQEQDDDLWRVWQANDMDEQSQLGHVDALSMRRYYVAVGTNEDDEDTPLVTAESPLEVFADIDPRTRKPRAALRRINERESLVRLAERYATLYLPDATNYYDWDGGWRLVDRDEHNLGVLPIVPVVNRARLANTERLRSGRSQIRYGRSELDAVIPLSDAANKIATDMMVAAEVVALPLRGFFGIEPNDLNDREGNQITAIQALMRKFLTVPTGTDEGAETFEFTAASLSNFHESINSLAKLVASIAGLPPDYMGLSTDNPPSAESRLAGEIRLIKRAERKQRAYGGSYEEVGRLIKRFQSGDWDPRLRRLETVWRDASTPTVAQSADAAVKLYTTTPKPIVPLRQTRKNLNFTDAQIDNMEAEDAKTERNAPLTRIAMGLGMNGSEPEPAGVGT